MTLPFNQIPVDIRTVGSHLEFDSSKAVSGLTAAPNKILLIGQRFATGAIAALTATRIVTRDQATQGFGRGSQLDRMARAAKLNDSETEMWAIALDDLVAGTAATGTITATSAATASGTLALMIAGQSVPVGLVTGDAVGAIATKIAAAINANIDLPVTAAAVAAIVTLTARHKGTAANDIDVRLNYYEGETTPTGVVLTIAPMAAGAGNPDVTAIWAALGDGEQYQTIIIGFSDAATKTAAEAEMSSRWGPMRQVEGRAYFAERGTQGALAALGAARNSAHSSIIGANKSPTPPCEWAAAYGAVAGFALAIDPARPLQTLSLTGILPPANGDRFTRNERELLLRDGISTFTVDSGGIVRIERAITTYQTNAFGIDDLSYLDINTTATLAYLRYAVRARIAQKFPRHKLADDGIAFGIGQFVVTPKIIKAELVALFREMEEAGLVENLEQFKADLLVERDATDRNRINALIPPNLVNQLRVFAGLVEFRL
jgi:phage tail sheath gpL-like